MATQAYIIEKEEELLAAQNTINQIMSAFKYECVCNDGPVNKVNNDLWLSLSNRADAVKRDLDKLIDAFCEPY